VFTEDDYKKGKAMAYEKYRSRVLAAEDEYSQRLAHLKRLRATSEAEGTGKPKGKRAKK